MPAAPLRAVSLKAVGRVAHEIVYKLNVCDRSIGHLPAFVHDGE